jgi:hypothetical protein
MAPQTPRMPNAPAGPAGSDGRSGDTRHSGQPNANAAERVEKAEDKPAARPRTDTIALVEKNASRPREVPTWLAVVAIVALSLVAGMTTYLVRLKATAPTDPSTTTTASAAYDKGATAKPRVPAP